MYVESDFQSRYQKPAKSIYRQKDEKAWGQVFEERVMPNSSVKPAFAIGTQLTMNDQRVNLPVTVVKTIGFTRCEVIDGQGFIHQAEVLSEDDETGADLRAIVSPRSKYSAGYAHVIESDKIPKYLS